MGAGRACSKSRARRRTGRCCRNTAESAATRARAMVVASKFLGQLSVDADEPVAALDIRLTRGNRRRRLLVSSKDASAS
jgi:hypothetical protein